MPMPITAPERSPALSIAGDSTLSGSLLALVSVDDTPYPPRQLLEGQTHYDRDADGVKYAPKDDLTDPMSPLHWTK